MEDWVRVARRALKGMSVMWDRWGMVAGLPSAKPREPHNNSASSLLLLSAHEIAGWVYIWLWHNNNNKCIIYIANNHAYKGACSQHTRPVGDMDKIL